MIGNPGARSGGHLTVEQAAVTFFCAAESYRSAQAANGAQLARRADPDELLALMTRLNVLWLAGSRMLTAADVPQAFRDLVQKALDGNRRRGELHDLVATGVLDALERSGIQAVPLKGSTLARRIHGDVGLRASSDVDVLVAAAELPEAVAAVQALGWTLMPRGRAELPLLHEVLVHPALPSVELHWRLHWYEDAFATDVVRRATREQPSEPLRMQPVDELASLLLFYARDGFTGLRLPADIAAWWSRDGGHPGRAAELEQRLIPFPALSRAIRTAAEVSARLGRFEFAIRAPKDRRASLARALVNPYLDGSAEQIHADTSVVDFLLSPRRQTTAAIARDLDRAPGPEPTQVHARLVRRGRQTAKVTVRWSQSLAKAQWRVRSRSYSNPFDQM